MQLNDWSVTKKFSERRKEKTFHEEEFSPGGLEAQRRKVFVAGNFFRSAPVKQSRECQFIRKELTKMKCIRLPITGTFLSGA
jgi:hypothetical protein